VTYYRARNLKVNLTNANGRVEKVWHGCEHDVRLVGSQRAGHVGREPVHDDVVGPVHGEMGNVDGPQGPVAHKLSPVHICVVYLINNTCLTASNRYRSFCWIIL